MAEAQELLMVKPSAKMARRVLWSWQAWPALLTIVLPVLFTALYAVSVDKVVGNPDWAQLLNVLPNGSSIDVFARDLGGHLQFAVASTLLRLAAFGAVALFVFTVAWRRSIGEAIAILVAVIGVYVVIYRLSLWFDHGGISNNEPVRENIRNALQQTGHKILDVDVASRVNQWADLIGGGALLACFAAVALGPAKDDVKDPAEGETDDKTEHSAKDETKDKTKHSAEHEAKNKAAAASLQSRMRELERTTIFAAVFLVLMTAVNKSLTDWPQAFLAESQQKAYAYLAGAISGFWGTYASLFLVLALLLAFIGLKLDIDSSAESSAKADAANWKKDNGLEFDTKSGIGAAIAAIAPILTVPGIDLASKLLH
jgi:hypothetical protein